MDLLLLFIKGCSPFSIKNVDSFDVEVDGRAALFLRCMIVSFWFIIYFEF